MLDSVKNWAKRNQVTLIVISQTAVGLTAVYFIGYATGSIQAVKLWLATNQDYELFQKFLVERGLLDEFNQVLLDRGMKEGSLRYLLPT